MKSDNTIYKPAALVAIRTHNLLVCHTLAAVGHLTTTCNLLRQLPPAAAILCMRDQCLLPFLARSQAQGFVTIVPDVQGQDIYRLPPSDDLYQLPGALPRPLRLRPLPYGSTSWRAPVDVVVVACTAWSPLRRHLWTLDVGQTAAMFEILYEGYLMSAVPAAGPSQEDPQPYAWRLPAGVPVVCLAADEQELSADWPERFAGHRAQFVVTPTRVVELGGRAGALPAVAVNLKDRRPFARISL